MKTSALLISVFICGYVIFFTELARKEIVYDCRVLMGGWHPDIPQQVIKQCKGLI